MVDDSDAIAIIGIGCRYPGVKDTTALWRLLVNGESAVREIPPGRFGDLEDYYDPRPATPGRMMSRYGGFLEDIERFDADFFGISPLEARQLDPQQRVLLEVAWEALEDAGIPAGRLAGSTTGVFIGSWLQDFETRLIGNPAVDDLRNIDLYTTTGSGRYPLSGRISYFFGFQGPSMVVDTACSSSLVAIHLARRSLLQKESQVALAGGVNIVLTPYITVAYSQSRMMAPDGRCKFGDARADGYVRSEGCGLLVLKRLSAALADGDDIYAVIHGSAVNNDGRTSGYLTTPGGVGQQDVLKKALGDAGILPNQVQYVEAHGTGTLAGDPVELGALGAVLSEGRSAETPCLVGSIKTNLGHTEGAAGVAGLIKVALALKHRQIPASLNLSDLNPNIPWNDLALQIPTQTIAWPSQDDDLVAGVSAFGITGTNVHIVLGQAPENQAVLAEPSVAPGAITDKWLLPLSAHSIEALRAMAQRFGTSLATAEEAPDIGTLCATAALKRDHHDFRAAVIADGWDQMGASLEGLANGESKPGVVFTAERVRPQGKLAFVYPGQGSQWLGMCRALMPHSAVFRQTMQRCEAVLKTFVDWSLLEQINASTSASRLNDISVIQPVLFAIQVALTEQWRAWGVKPDAVIGHSMGEPAAAYAAGVLDLEAATKIITARSRLMKRTSGQGAMALVELTMEEAAETVKGYEGRLSIAVSNSPRSTVLAGDPAALNALLEQLERRQVFCRKINVDVASHSPQMVPLRDELVATLDGLVAHTAALPIYSTVAAGRLEGEDFKAAYWGRNLCRPVRFAETIAAMLADGHTIYIEMSPHPVLLRAIDECAQADPSEQGRMCATLPSLLRKEDEPVTLLESLGRLYVLGHPFDWQGLYATPVSRLALPTYPWQRERHWFEETTGKSSSRRIANRTDGRRRHALLENYIHSAIHPDLHLWESTLDTERLPWLKDHSVQGHLVFPAAAFVETAAAAGEEALCGPVELLDLDFHEALFAQHDAVKRLQVVISKSESADWALQMLSQPARSRNGQRPWREHVHGRLSAAQDSSEQIPVLDVEAIRARCDQVIPGDRHFTAMQRLQIGYGPAFRGIERIGAGNNEAVARIRSPQVIAADSTDFRIHPALLDAGLQLLVSLTCGVDEAERGGAWMPVGIEKTRLFAPQSVSDELWAVGRVREDTVPQEGWITGDVYLLEKSGCVLAEMRGVVMRQIAYALSEDIDRWLYEMVWYPRPLSIENDEGHAGLGDPEKIARRVLAEPLPDQLVKDGDTAKVLLPQLEGLSVDYFASALVRLGLQFEPGRSFTANQLVEDLQIEPRHRKLFDRMLVFLVQEGFLEQTGEVMRITKTLPQAVSVASEQQLLADYPQCRAELTMLQRCGRQLSEALTGKVDTLELLFPGGSLNDAEAFYHDAVFARVANHQAGLALKAAIEGWPEGQTLRILEIGAGTGGLTSHVLPLLPAERTRYMFTDIGPAFVTRARGKYTDVTWLDYAVLDIEKDPVAQGFEPNRYDIVLAANCLHATRDMHATLNHVRMLLAPGGLMLLLEGTRARRWIDMVFGLTEGWWRFEDVDRRPSHPLMNADEWKAALFACGFAEAEVFAPSLPMLFDQSVVAARTSMSLAVAADRPDYALDKAGWLIFADRTGVGEALAQRLSEQGDECNLVYRAEGQGSDAIGANGADPVDYNHLLAKMETFVGQGPRAVLYLWPLEDAAAEPASREALNLANRQMCGQLLPLAQAMARQDSSRRVCLWVATLRAVPTGQENGQLSLSAAPLAGLVKVIDLEHPELRCRLVDLEGDPELDPRHLYEALRADTDETITVYRNNQRLVPRVRRLGERSESQTRWIRLPLEEPFELALEKAGTFDGLRVQTTTRPRPASDEVLIRVRASGLNFRDVLTVLGAYPGDNPSLGLEAAGEVVALGDGVDRLSVGDEVLALGKGAFGTFMVAKAALVMAKPAGLSLAQAAALPIAYLTAHYGLDHLAGLRAGERVLIHAASGGVGLAAVQIARAYGAEIFGTAGNPDKRTYLQSLGVAHVLDSRSLDFADHILQITDGEGVDVVLNSLSEAFITRSFEVLKPDGRFIELGKRGILTREQAADLRPDAYYEAFDLTDVMARSPEMLRSMLAKIVSAIDAGQLGALPTKVYPMESVVEAMQFMQKARHVGKLALVQPKWGAGHAVDSADAFEKHGTYLITGAFGGIGPALAKWLFERGARHFVLTGPRVPQAAAAAKIAKLEAAGAQIRTATCDVASEAHVQRLLTENLAQMPQLRGVFHLAGALDDGALMQQNWQRFETVFAPKVLGAWNLHQATRGYALDCFVLFSSWSSFLGSQGQANHSAANAFLDALAWYRQAVGLPAVSINWGAWAEIGAATKGEAAEHLRRRGIGSFAPEMGLRALGALMSQGAVQAAVTPFDLAMWRQASPAASRSVWFEYLEKELQDTAAADAGQTAEEDAAALVDALQAAPSDAERLKLLESFLKTQTAQTLKLPVARLDVNKPFKSYGMDSLTALEFRNRVEAATGTTLSATLVFNYPTIQALEGFLLDKLRDRIETAVPADPGEPEPGSGDPESAIKDDESLLSLLNEVEALSEEDAQRMLDDES